MSEPTTPQVPSNPTPAARDDFDLLRATQAHIDQKNTVATPPPATVPDPVVKTDLPAAPPSGPARNPLDALKVQQDNTQTPTSDVGDKEIEEFEKTLPQPYDGMAPKTRESWDKMRESMKQTKKEALEAKRAKADYEKQLDDLKKSQTTVDDTEFKKTKEERDTLLKKNAIWELELDQKFQQNVEQPLNQAYESLDQIVTTFKLDASKVDAAFRSKPGPERNKALNEIVEDAHMTPFDVEDFKKAVGSIVDLGFKKQQAYQNAMTLNEAAQQRTKEEAQKKVDLSQRQIQEADTKFWDKLTKDVRVIKDILKDTTYANELRDMVKTHRTSEPDVEVKMLADYAPYLLPKVVELVESRDKEIANLKKTIKERIGGDAPAGGGHAPAARPQAEEKLNPGEDVGRAFQAWKSGQR